MLKKDISDTFVRVEVRKLSEELTTRYNTDLSRIAAKEERVVSEDEFIDRSTVREIMNQYFKIKKELLLDGYEVVEPGIGSSRLKFRASTTFNHDENSKSIPTVVLGSSLDKEVRKDALENIMESDDEKFLSRIKAVDKDGNSKLTESMKEYIKGM